MKKVAIAILCVLSVANAQDKRFAFKGNAAQAGSGGISTATARQNTGWTSNGTTAQDTLATYYDINGKFQRLRIADTDGDSLILAPHALFPLVGKDGTLLLFAFDSTGRMGINAATAAQAQRAFMNVLGRATNDTLAIWSNDGGGVVGDSAVAIDAGGRMGIKTFPSASYGLTVSGGSAANIAAASYEVGNGGSGTLSNTSSGSSISMLGGGAFGGGMRFNAAASGNRTDRSFWFQNASDTLAAFGLGTANKGYYSFGNGIKPQSQNQAIFTVRPAVPVSDTTFMVRNDANSTLDSTMMVFANGRILRRDTKALPAGAWLATASNGAALSSSNYMVTYAFDTATAETLTVDFPLPPNFIQISNVEIEVVAPNTDGDSVGFAIAWLGRAADEAFDVAFSSALSGQIDLGTTANVRKILTISGTFSNLAASDRIILKLWRDPSVANDVAADVHLVEVRVNGNGLLY